MVRPLARSTKGQAGRTGCNISPKPSLYAGVFTFIVKNVMIAKFSTERKWLHMLAHKSPEYLRGRYSDLMQRVVPQHHKMRDDWGEFMEAVKAVESNSRHMIQYPLSGVGVSDGQILLDNQRAIEAWKAFQASQAVFMTTRRQIQEVAASQRILYAEKEEAAQSA